jgi:hypothetical protein
VLQAFEQSQVRGCCIDGQIADPGNFQDVRDDFDLSCLEDLAADCSGKNQRRGQAARKRPLPRGSLKPR